MERRKLLLGSGVGLVTVLAGCSSEDLMNSDEADDEESNGSDGNGNEKETPGNANKSGKNGDEKDKKDEKDEKDDKNDGSGNRDVPGIDVDKFEALLEQQGITLETLRRSGPNLTLEVSVSDLNADELLDSSADNEELRRRLSDIVSAAADAVTDPRAFISAIETITVSIVDETDGKKNKNGKPGLTLEIRVSWLIEFLRNQRSEEELLDRITETASEGE